MEKVQDQLVAVWGVTSKTTEIYSSCGQLGSWSVPKFAIDHVASVGLMLLPHHKFDNSLMFTWLKLENKKSVHVCQFFSHSWKENEWGMLHLIEENKIQSELFQDIQKAIPVSFKFSANSKGQACLCWKSGDFNEEVIKSSIWNGNFWTTTHCACYKKIGEQVHFVCGIDDDGNALIAWEKKPFLFLFSKYTSSFCTYYDGQWSGTSELPGSTALPFIFNYKGRIILTWVKGSNGLVSRFALYKNGLLKFQEFPN